MKAQGEPPGPGTHAQRFFPSSRLKATKTVQVTKATHSTRRLPRVVTEAAANTFYLAEFFMIGSATKIGKPLGALVQREKLKEGEGDKDRKSVLRLAAPAPQAWKERLCGSWWGQQLLSPCTGLAGSRQEALHLQDKTCSPNRLYPHSPASDKGGESR